MANVADVRVLTKTEDTAGMLDVNGEVSGTVETTGSVFVGMTEVLDQITENVKLLEAVKTLDG